MPDRIRFVNDGSKKILLVDFSNCPANEVEEIARTVPNYTTVQPLSIGPGAYGFHRSNV